VRDFHTFEKGGLTLGKHRVIETKVSLEVLTEEDDEWAEEDDGQIYDDGVRATGELQVDVWFNNNIIRPGLTGELQLRDDGENSRFNIIILDMLHVEVIVPNKQKRYWYSFHPVGKPLHDGLELFPPNYKREPLKVFTVTNFTGRWPVGVSAVVVANSRKEARTLVDTALEKQGILTGQEKRYDLDELDIHTPQALILHDGSF